jgi:hypothetical protein
MKTLSRWVRKKKLYKLIVRLRTSLEEALAAMGVVVWPMIELGADDALWPRISRRRKGKRVTAYFVTNC